MLGLAPDYDHLTVIQKVEVFEHALESTSGEDLHRVMWLKSRSSEVGQRPKSLCNQKDFMVSGRFRKSGPCRVLGHSGVIQSVCGHSRLKQTPLLRSCCMGQRRFEQGLRHLSCYKGVVDVICVAAPCHCMHAMYNTPGLSQLHDVSLQACLLAIPPQSWGSY